MRSFLYCILSMPLGLQASVYFSSLEWMHVRPKLESLIAGFEYTTTPYTTSRLENGILHPSWNFISGCRMNAGVFFPKESIEFSLQYVLWSHRSSVKLTEDPQFLHPFVYPIWNLSADPEFTDTFELKTVDSRWNIYSEEWRTKVAAICFAYDFFTLRPFLGLFYYQQRQNFFNFYETYHEKYPRAQAIAEQNTKGLGPIFGNEIIIAFLRLNQAIWNLSIEWLFALPYTKTDTTQNVYTESMYGRLTLQQDTEAFYAICKAFFETNISIRYETRIWERYILCQVGLLSSIWMQYNQIYCPLNYPFGWNKNKLVLQGFVFKIGCAF